MRNLIIITLLLTLSGCLGGVEVSSQGNMVRQISVRDSNECQHLGVVLGEEMLGWTQAGDRRSALNKVRNKTAELGGNAYVLNDVTVQFGASAQADAYKC
ncbi:DUF4156 domain-containing protein [Paracoccaceae bacterium]|nr:DUF4156 domain-containing protein [Paracoccaceae bacterium]